MAKAKLIDVELMRSLLEYAPELGGSCLRWKVDKGNSRTGDMAGCQESLGYWVVKINRVVYKAHRIVWAIVKGEDPVAQIDHIHGHLAGNNIENLRLAIRGPIDNNQNTKLPSSNTSGYQGVTWHKRDNKWQASIKVNGKSHHLGYFDTPEEAHAAYLEAKARLHMFQPTPRGTT